MDTQHLSGLGASPEPEIAPDWFTDPGADENELWEPWLSEVTCQDITCFKFPVLDQLRRQPYHTATLQGPFNVKALVKDHRTALFRSHTILNRQGQARADRLLFNLGDARFGYYEHGNFMVYAPTPETAAALVAEFRRYLHPPGCKRWASTCSARQKARCTLSSSRSSVR